MLGTTDEVVTRLFAAAPGAADSWSSSSRAARGRDDVALELPISVYGGGFHVTVEVHSVGRAPPGSA